MYLLKKISVSIKVLWIGILVIITYGETHFKCSGKEQSPANIDTSPKF